MSSLPVFILNRQSRQNNTSASNLTYNKTRARKPAVQIECTNTYLSSHVLGERNREDVHSMAVQYVVLVYLLKKVLKKTPHILFLPYAHAHAHTFTDTDT